MKLLDVALTPNTIFGESWASLFHWPSIIESTNKIHIQQQILDNLFLTFVFFFANGFELGWPML